MSGEWFVCVLAYGVCIDVNVHVLKLKDHFSYLAPGRGQLYLFPVEWYFKMFLIDIKHGD